MPAKKNPPALVSENVGKIAFVDKSKRAKIERPMVPHDTWLGAVLVNTEMVGPDKNGNEANELTFEVTGDKRLRGMQFRKRISVYLEKSLDESNEKSLAANFPGVDLLDDEATWDALNGVPLRIHIGHQTYPDVTTGEIRTGYYVGGVMIDKRKLVK